MKSEKIIFYVCPKCRTILISSRGGQIMSESKNWNNSDGSTDVIEDLGDIFGED